MEIEWIKETRKIDELHEFSRNARRLNKHDAEHLKRSIQKFGQCEPIVINTDNIIIGGHQRLRTMRALKYKTVDVCVPIRALTDKEVEELNIRLNKNTGEFDFDILANAWEVNDLLDWGFETKDLGIDDDGVDQASDQQDSLEKIVVFTIKISNEEASSFENQLDTLLFKFPEAKMKRK